MKYPALDVDGIDSDFLLALVDDFHPSAVDTQESVVTVFFFTAAERARAREAIATAYPDAGVNVRDVDDEDWARRSQDNLEPVTVGRITVAPPWLVPPGARHNPQPVVPQALPSDAHLQTAVVMVIAPSMGFGTGHHATTRLCLRALQELSLAGCRVLDVGTGSGVLAIAACLLGAAEALGIDDDPDAIASALENLDHNSGADRVRFQVQDLRAAPLPVVEVVTANLTGALLIRSAALLVTAVGPGGSVIVSGLQIHERDEVVQAFGTARVIWEAVENEWVGITFRL